MRRFAGAAMRPCGDAAVKWGWGRVPDATLSLENKVCSKKSEFTNDKKKINNFLTITYQTGHWQQKALNKAIVIIT